MWPPSKWRTVTRPAISASSCIRLRRRSLVLRPIVRSRAASARPDACPVSARCGSERRDGTSLAFGLSRSRGRSRGIELRLPCIHEIAVILADVRNDQRIDDVARRADGDEQVRGGSLFVSWFLLNAEFEPRRYPGWCARVA